VCGLTPLTRVYPRTLDIVRIHLHCFAPVETSLTLILALIRSFLRTHKYAHTYIHTHIHTYIHTHTYTHTHTHTHTPSLVLAKARLMRNASRLCATCFGRWEGAQTPREWSSERKWYKNENRPFADMCGAQRPIDSAAALWANTRLSRHPHSQKWILPLQMVYSAGLSAWFGGYASIQNANRDGWNRHTHALQPHCEKKRNKK